MPEPAIHYISPQGVCDAWVGNELRTVAGSGIPAVLHALRNPPTQFFSSPWAARLHSDTRVIYPLPPLRALASFFLAPFLFRRKYFGALANALFGQRESFRCRLAGLWHFLVACHWARGLRKEPVRHIHSQWIHSAGTVGMYGAWLLGVSFSFTGHAADLFRERCALLTKVRRADFIVCISSFHRDFYLSLGTPASKLHVVYCGIDPSKFAPKPRSVAKGLPLRILSAGRLVEKKGFRFLLEACRHLANRGHRIACVIRGSGPLETILRNHISALHLEDRVTLDARAVTQEELPAFLQSGDVFCLPCVRAADGDVDGLPQVLMEAMACGLPAISTRLVGIPDLIVDGESGLLVSPDDSAALASALEQILTDPNLRTRLAENGLRRVREVFEIRTALSPLIRIFREKLTPAAADPAKG